MFDFEFDHLAGYRFGSYVASRGEILVLHRVLGKGNGCLESISDLAAVPFKLKELFFGPLDDFLLVHLVVFLCAFDIIGPYLEPTLEIRSFVVEGNVDAGFESLVENSFSISLIRDRLALGFLGGGGGQEFLPQFKRY